jgi:cobalt/nickel transport system permease protein
VHIPDGFLSARVAAATWVIAATGIASALRVERKESAPLPSGILGSVAAFLFAAQMVNVPVAPGTSGHLIGATLAAVLFGPWRALLAVATVLAVQALLFQDGGIVAYGANLVDMGLAGCFAGYAVTRVIARRRFGPRGIAIGAVFGAFTATVCGAVLVSLWLSLSGLCPLSGILPVMLVTHVAIGILEAALTGAIVVALLTFRPDLVGGLDEDGGSRRPVVLALGLLGAALAVAAFVAPHASVLPDGLEKSAEIMGFAFTATSSWPRLTAFGPAVAGVIGTAATAALAFAISRTLAGGDHDAHR